MATLSNLSYGGVSYEIKDAAARSAIDALQKYTNYLGVTTTELTDGASTNPITINGDSVTAKKGEIANYGSKEFIFNGTVWQEFGDLSGLGSLAFKDSASGTATVASKDVTVPSQTFTTPSYQIITGASGSVNLTNASKTQWEAIGLPNTVASVVTNITYDSSTETLTFTDTAITKTAINVFANSGPLEATVPSQTIDLQSESITLPSQTVTVPSQSVDISVS